MEDISLSFIDIIAAIGIGYGAMKGLSNGVIKEVAGLVGIVLGIWGGFRFAFVFVDFYTNKSQVPEKFIPFLAFLTSFIVVLGLVLFLGKLLKVMLEKASLTTVDKLAGAAFGAIKIGFIIGSIFTLIGKAGFFNDETKENSISYPILTTMCEGINEYTIALIPKAKNVFTELDSYFLKIESKRKGEEVLETEDDSGN